MAVRQKPVSQQVIVLTGASSGIGLATARAAAERGARLVLVARNEAALCEIAIDCERRAAGAVLPVVGDVAKPTDLERAAEQAIAMFGGFDTWVNNAGVAIYGGVEEVPIEDQRRLFEVDYWGVVNGSLIAARHLRRRGGTIVNVGSVLSDRAVILQGPYCAAKHAVKAFTDVLRMELEHDGAPIAVTLIKPSGIDTAYMEHARNYLDSPGVRVPPPAYDPALVAKAILFAAENPRRDLVIGFGGWAIAMMGALMPRATDLFMEAVGTRIQTTDKAGRRERRDNLYAPREDGSEHSSDVVATHRRTSLLLEAQLHPLTSLVAVAALGALGAAALMRGGKGRARQEVRASPRRGRPLPTIADVPRYEAAARRSTTSGAAAPL